MKERVPRNDNFFYICGMSFKFCYLTKKQVMIVYQSYLLLLCFQLIILNKHSFLTKMRKTFNTTIKIVTKFMYLLIVIEAQ